MSGNWHLGIVWGEDDCLPLGEVAEITAVGPFLYHTLDEIEPTGFDKFIDYGSANQDYKPFDTTTGNGADLLIEPNDPFCYALRLFSSGGECATSNGVTFNGVTTTTTYSAFCKFADSFSLPAIMTISANGNSPVSFTNREHWFVIGTAGDMNLFIYNGNTQTQFQSSTGVVPNDGAWHMLSAVFVPNSSVRMYVDGVEVFADTTGIPASKNDPSMQKSWGAISSSNTASLMVPTFSFNGWMAHCFIELSALSAATLLGIHDAVLG